MIDAPNTYSDPYEHRLFALQTCGCKVHTSSVIALVGVVGGGVAGEALLGLSRGCRGGRRRHMWLEQGIRKLGDPVQLECVEEFDGEDDLVQQHLAIATREYPRPSRYCQIRVCIIQVRPLHTQSTQSHSKISKQTIRV